MKRILFTLYIILYVTVSNAQSYSYNTKFTLSARNFVDTIPIEYVDNQIYVRVTSGIHTYRLCLDTGSSQGIVYTDGSFPYVRKLGKIISHDANGASSEIEVVQYPDFTLGHLTIHGYSGSYLRSAVGHRDYDAVLGFDLVNKGLAMKIDTEAGVMILSDNSNYFEQEEGYTLKYKLPRWVPIITISPYHGCFDEVRFDSGSRRLYVMSDETFQRLRYQGDDFSSQIEGISYGRRAIGSFGAERSSEVGFLWLDRMRWGDYSFYDYHTMTTQGKSRIGAEIFHYGSVVFNPRRKTVKFQPYSHTPSCMVSNNQMEIAFVPSNGRPSVGLIWEGSRHYKNGFRQGDIITHIDGKRIVTFQQFLSYPFLKGYSHMFTVVGVDGETRIVESER